ncbi:MAG: hypothetical protein U5L11_02515 [Arhodomonas sp.]|nr:hypothetical protein [Arhodomonas sp.]
MATKYWQPKAQPVAQVTTVTVGGTLSGETFSISVGGLVIATHTDATTTIADTVAALVAAWNASTHPYATGITAADASPDITLTADTAEVPFAVTLNTPEEAPRSRRRRQRHRPAPIPWTRQRTGTARRYRRATTC